MLMLAGYTAAIIGFPAVSRPEAVFDIAVARVTEIVLGITCATLAHSLLWPKSVATALEPRLKRWLADARAWYDDILAGAELTTRCAIVSNWRWMRWIAPAGHTYPL
jgi:uncharacterized membrane protein YccC